MMKRLILGLLIVLLPSGAWADSGWYISGDLGVDFAKGLDTTGYSNDRSSVCDEFINPMYASVFGREGYTSESVNCTGPNRGATGDWNNSFDNAAGVLAGAAIGYSIGKKDPHHPWAGLRMEFEYFYRQSNFDQTSTVHGFDCTPPFTNESTQKLCDEIRQATDRLDSMNSHNLFANLYYDWANTTKWTPYLGIGGGVGFTDVGYQSVWARNRLAESIDTGDGLPNAAEIRRNLAGTVSVGRAKLRDMLWGFQVLFGVDYEVTETVALGVKGRWARYSDFDSGHEVVWDPLRSHEPNIRLDGSEPVSGGLRTQDIEFLGVSINLKYHY